MTERICYLCGKRAKFGHGGIGCCYRLGCMVPTNDLDDALYNEQRRTGRERRTRLEALIPDHAERLAGRSVLRHRGRGAAPCSQRRTALAGQRPVKALERRHNHAAAAPAGNVPTEAEIAAKRERAAYVRRRLEAMEPEPVQRGTLTARRMARMGR